MMINSAQAMTLDEAKVKRTVYGFSALADHGAFEYLGAVMAPQVSVDYTSLFGGQAELLKRETLMNRWSEFLPGFDITFHELSDMKVMISGNNATVNVNFTASHWLGDTGFWQISGRYEFVVIKSADLWLISSIKTIADSEQGSRDILSGVAQHANKNLAATKARLVSYQ